MTVIQNSRGPSGPDRQLIDRLALERCRQHLAHMQALLHLCETPGVAGPPVRQTLQRLIALTDSELGESLARRR